jgi:hypothetical protein
MMDLELSDIDSIEQALESGDEGQIRELSKVLIEGARSLISKVGVMAEELRILQEERFNCESLNES